MSTLEERARRAASPEHERPNPALGANLAGMAHTAHGYWLEEAGPVTPQPPLTGTETADVAIVGGGYAGMWTAWWITERDPTVAVAIVEADVCGRGPSGRNGGFVNSLWHALPELRKRVGDEAAIAVCMESEASITEIGEWCEQHGVDAWYRAAPRVSVSAAPAQDDHVSAAAEACLELGFASRMRAISAAEMRERCASPVFRDGVLMEPAATVQPARLAQGLRARLLERGVRIFEGSRAVGVEPAGGGVVVRTEAGELRAATVVAAVHERLADLTGLRRRMTVASSHIILTEPVPDVLEEVNWTGGEAMSDGRAFLHYFRTTRDGRIAFGWGGGRLALGQTHPPRIDRDPLVIVQIAKDLVRVFPQLRGRFVTHAWGGPIDVSPTHLPVVGTAEQGLLHYVYGFTGNGVGPSHFAGKILSLLALGRREDPLTRLAIVDPPVVKLPPEPLRFVGGALVRSAFLAKEAREEAGEAPGALVSAICDMPRRLGIHLGR